MTDCHAGCSIVVACPDSNVELNWHSLPLKRSNFPLGSLSEASVINEGMQKTLLGEECSGFLEPDVNSLEKTEYSFNKRKIVQHLLSNNIVNLVNLAVEVGELWKRHMVIICPDLCLFYLNIINN